MSMGLGKRRCKPVSRSKLWKVRIGLVLACAAMATASQAQTFTTLVSFPASDGFFANSLVQGTDGNLYGTSNAGGANSNCYLGCGTIFKVSAQGVLSNLFSFNGANGQYPEAGLTLATDRNFYGTTSGGGNTRCSQGCGTVFQFTPGGTLTTLHSFDDYDGFSPSALLMQAANGDLYGTTYGGGSKYNYGTVFKISLSGVFTMLYAFQRHAGQAPSGLIQARNEDFYGTTPYGGEYGAGTLFKITGGGTLTTLHSFPHNFNPTSGVVQGTDGNLYGTIGAVVGNNHDGKIYKVTAGATPTTLHTFIGSDGDNPGGALVQGTDGNFYGTTQLGGANGLGTIFRIAPDGTFATLYNLASGDGTTPLGPLIQGTDGSLYGTTQRGGANNQGTVFKLSVGLGPFVRAVPAFGPVGTSVSILGTNLAGAISVSFNGAAAAFLVVSPTEIAATVPANATSGAIRVTLPAAHCRAIFPSG